MTEPNRGEVTGMAQLKEQQRTTIHSNQPWFVLGAANQYELVMSHDPTISHFYGFEADADRGLVFAVPDGCVDIVFDCDPDSPRARVCGTTLEARSVELKHQHRYFGVRFALGVIPDFLDTVAEELVEQEVNLRDLMPDATRILERIVSQTSITDQSIEFQQAFAGQPTRKSSAVTRQVLSLICTRKGNIKVQEVASETGWSRRTILRQVQEDIGLSPKTVCRIIRCQSAMHDINYRHDVAFSQLAQDLGFSDQPHFLREFKRLVNATPAEYQGKIRDQSYLSRIRHCQIAPEQQVFPKSSLRPGLITGNTWQ
jgi:AraC-like DNA-binding protein